MTTYQNQQTTPLLSIGYIKSGDMIRILGPKFVIFQNHVTTIVKQSALLVNALKQKIR